MASNCSSSSAKHLAVVVFIFGLLSQYQLEATRDSQFFSKVTNSNTNSNGAKEQTTQQGEGHGLVYNDKGRSDDQILPNNVDVSDTTTSTKSNDESYNYQTEQASELDGTTDQGYPTTYNDKAYVTKPQGYIPNYNNNKYYNTNNYGSYENQPQNGELSGTSLMDQSGHSTTYNNNDNGLNTYNPQQQQQQQFSQEEKDAVLSYNNNNNYNGEGSYNVNNNNNNYNGEGSYNVNNNNNNNNRYNGQQEGMSDTRFLENGRYHYNVKTNQYNNNNNLPTFRYSRNNNYDNNNPNSFSYNNNYNYDSIGYANQSDENEEQDSFNP